MKISMWMLADCLKEYHPVATITENSFAIESARLFSSELPSNNHTVYIGRLCDLFHTSSGQVICTHKNDMLLLQTTDLEEILNCVLNALEFYSAWSVRMLELLASDAMLQDLFDTTQSVLPQPVFLLDASQRFLAHMQIFHRGEVDSVWDDMVAFGSPDIDFLINVNQAYPERFSKKDIYVLEPDLFPNRCYNKNFFFQDKWLGTAVQIEHCPNTSQGQLDVFSLFCDFLQRWFEIHIQEEQSVILDSLLLSAITDQNAANDELLRRLQLMGWKADDTLLFFKLDTRFQPFPLNLRLCKTLNLKFDFLFACNADPSICVLANLRLAPLEEVISQLKPWLKNGRYYGMQGRPFTMTDSFYRQYRYAAITSEYCEKNPGQIYEGGAYVLPYILWELKGTILPEASHPALGALLDYDKKHHTQLYQTLYIYLKNERSLILTAKEMQLHRNSLLYRIRRLQELLDADLENSMVRLHLLLSYEIAGDM
ncbi:MAG: hypothetical protein HFI76_13605 [Lachnospiraceae bacterium]|nr:hypothetical protein [Lachnospiraceae bacterium]